MPGVPRSRRRIGRSLLVGSGGVFRRPVQSAKYTPLAFIVELREARILGSIVTVGDALDCENVGWLLAA
jgi:hypothetical protein